MYRKNFLPLSVIMAILLANAVVFLLEQTAIGDNLLYLLALWPLGNGASGLMGQAIPHFQIWQLVSYSFLHATIWHIFFNMYALWLFGSRMEMFWGPRNFAIYYFVCVIGAGLVQLFVATHSAESGAVYPTIGASGGVFGVLLAFGVSFPEERLMLIFPPIMLRAKWLVIIYGGIELFFGVTGTMAGVAHFAHLGGMLFGYLLIRYWRSHPPRYR